MKKPKTPKPLKIKADDVPNFKMKEKLPMKVEKLTTPVGMNNRPKWVDSVK